MYCTCTFNTFWDRHGVLISEVSSSFEMAGEESDYPHFTILTRQLYINWYMSIARMKCGQLLYRFSDPLAVLPQSLPLLPAKFLQHLVPNTILSHSPNNRSNIKWENEGSPS